MGRDERGHPVKKGDHKQPSYPTRDHLLPRTRGGSNLKHNIAICCKRCNGDKKNRTTEEWHQDLARERDPRAKHVAKFLAGEYDASEPTMTEAQMTRQRGELQRLYEYFERIDPRPVQHVRYEWTKDGLASFPASSSGEQAAGDADLDDAGRARDPAG